MAEPQFNPDDKPTFNTFDLPTLCDGEDAERPCCDPCTDWIFCLRRSLYELTLAGFELEDWLAGHWLSSLTQYKASQAALEFTAGAAGETFVFDGVYIAEPPSPQGQAVACPLPEREDACTHTHRIRAERTLSTSILEGDEAKRFGLNVNTECVVVEDVKYLKFTVNLVWQGAKPNPEYEPAITNDPGDCDGDPGPCQCVEEKPETEYEPLEGSDWFCCPILMSDLIPVASITSLADLDDVTLNPLPPATATFSSFYGVYVYDTGDNQLCLQTNNVWVCTHCVALQDQSSPATCFLDMPINGCSTEIDGEPAPFATGDGEITGCTNGVYAGGGGAPGSGTCEDSHCISEPVEYVESGVYKLKVIDGKCRTPEDCGSCIPDEEHPNRRQAIKYGDVKFTYTPGASCSKTFTPIAPACLNIVKVYWSWGAVSTGLDTVTHTIVNVDPESPLRFKETISAILVDDRGCIYCWTEVVECGCCPGVTGSLSITQTGEEGCQYKLTASVTSTEDCPLAFIEYQVIGIGGCATDFLDCECNDLDPGEPAASCLPCSGSLVDGGEATINVSSGATLRYRVWDGVCGCASEWVYMPLYCAVCECCAGTIAMIRVTIGGVTGADPEVECPDCEALNRPYDLAPSAGGVNDCIWSVPGPDGLKCPPDSPFSFGSDVFFTFGCGNYGLGSPTVDDLEGSVSFTGGGSAGFQKLVADAGFPAENCEALSGSYPLISNTNGSCNLDGITASVEIVVAA